MKHPKRFRKDEHCQHSCWRQTVEWIQSQSSPCDEKNGKGVKGFISDRIQFNTDREIVVMKDIKKNDLIMQIPSSVLFTLATVERTPIGKDLFKIISSCEENSNKSSFFNSKDDLLLALFLAYIKCNASHLMNFQDYRNVLVYLKTLPSNESYDKIARKWSKEELDELLYGTSIHKRAHAERNGIRGDYELLKSAFLTFSFEDNRIMKERVFPTYEEVDSMLAAVGSRAFHECKFWYYYSYFFSRS